MQIYDIVVDPCLLMHYVAYPVTNLVIAYYRLYFPLLPHFLCEKCLLLLCFVSRGAQAAGQPFRVFPGGSVTLSLVSRALPGFLSRQKVPHPLSAQAGPRILSALSSPLTCAAWKSLPLTFLLTFPLTFPPSGLPLRHPSCQAAAWRSASRLGGTATRGSQPAFSCFHHFCFAVAPSRVG